MLLEKYLNNSENTASSQRKEETESGKVEREKEWKEKRWGEKRDTGKEQKWYGTFVQFGKGYSSKRKQRCTVWLAKFELDFRPNCSLG